MKFDALARHYDWLEAVTAGQRLQRTRLQWLDGLAGCRRILSVGEGHGRFAAACLERFPEAELTCVEASPAMLDVARRRAGAAAARARWECLDLFAWNAVQPFDAVATCFFLDCFPRNELEVAVHRLAGSLRERAVWLIADFAVPGAGPARWRAQAIHSLMYALFRACTALPARCLTPPDPLLQQHGFHLAARREFEWGLLRADLWHRGMAADR